MVSNLDGARDRGQKQTDVIIMDFAKAFVKVPHRRLLSGPDPEMLLPGGGGGH